MQGKIALAIITKNRPQELKRCLTSITKQSLLPDTILVIDNDPKCSAKVICQNHNKQFPQIRIKYKSEQGSVPHCRNIALTQIKSTYLGFIDDDCVLENDWLKQAIIAIKAKNADYVLGKTLLLNPLNIFALAQFAHDDYWKEFSNQIFDTKNVLLNLLSIRRHALMFDEKCQKDQYDSADFDFNFQVKATKLVGVFAPKMRLKHQEVTSFIRFKKRAIARGFLANYLNKKWQLNDQLVDFGQKNRMIWLLKLIKNFKKDYQKFNRHMGDASVFKKISATLLIRVFDHYYTLGYVEAKA